MILDDIVNLNITFKKLILIETISMINKIKLELIPERFRKYLLFSQLSSFNFNYSRNNYFYLDSFKFSTNNFPFPDYRERDKDPNLELMVISELQQDPCPCCGAILLRGMKPYFCCNGDLSYRIKLPDPNFPEEIMNKILETSSYNYPRNLNLDLRPEIHNSYITRKNAAYSTIFINGLPYPSSNPRKFHPYKRKK